MHTFIPSFLKEQEAGLRENLKKPQAICNLRSFSYKDNKTPDYTDTMHRQLYFLRYASAYMIEYYMAYKYIFETKKVIPSKYIATLSIGCGAMLDLIGFEFARKNTDDYSKLTPYYYGVDLVNWECQETKLIKNVKFFEQGIEELEPEENIDKALDILFFPKSISEIPQQCLDSFAAKLGENDLNSKIYIVNSRRGSSTTDQQAASKFSSNIAENCGYKIESHKFFDFSEKDPETYLSNFCPGKYSFDMDMGAWLNSLVNTYCGSSECSQEEKEDCSSIIDIWPTLKAKNISPEFYYLKKI